MTSEEFWRKALVVIWREYRARSDQCGAPREYLQSCLLAGRDLATLRFLWEREAEEGKVLAEGWTRQDIGLQLKRGHAVLIKPYHSAGEAVLDVIIKEKKEGWGQRDK